MHLVRYTICGTVYSEIDNFDKKLFVWGSMAIDNRLRLWDDSTTVPAQIAPPPPLGFLKYSYFVTEYGLILYYFADPQNSFPNTVYSFSGAAGSFYIERYEGGIGHTQWDLEQGSGDWTSWSGQKFSSFNTDLTQYDLYNKTDLLPPVILLQNIQTPGLQWLDIVLTKNEKVEKDKSDISKPENLRII